MSSPPYITIPLHPLHTASTGLTFLLQRQCPHHHISLFHCVHCTLHPLFWPFCTKEQCPHRHIPLIHCTLHPLVWPFCTKDNVPTTIYHYSTASTASTVYCVHCLTASTESTGLMFLHQRQCLLRPLCTASTVCCVHCMLRPLRPLCTVSTLWLHPLNPLVWPFCIKDNVPTTIYHYSTARCILRTASTGLTFLHQRQCPHHHIPLFHCVLHPLHPLVWPFSIKDNVPTTIYHYSTASTLYCIHTIESLLCNSYTTWYLRNFFIIFCHDWIMKISGGNTKHVLSPQNSELKWADSISRSVMWWSHVLLLWSYKPILSFNQSKNGFLCIQGRGQEEMT